MMEDYEKKHKEEVERATQLWEGGDITREQLEYIFPELQESEDDRIRKEITDLIMRPTWQTEKEFNRRKELAVWLKKQGEIDKESYEIAEKEKYNFVSGQFIECRKSFNEFKEDNSYWLEYIGNDNYIGRSDNILNQKFHITPRQLYCLFTQEHCPKENNVNEEANGPTSYGKYVDECLNDAAKHFFSEGEDNYSVADLFYAGVKCGKSWLEKQGRHKPVDKIQLGKKYKCIASPRYSTFRRGNIYKPVDNFLCSLMNFCSDCFEPIEDDEQKPVDNLEPKFHKGDWVISKINHNVYHVLNIEDNKYQVETLGCIFWYDEKYFDGLCRLWTIQDAKDGDVLAEDSCIFIIQKLGNKSTFAKTYCSLYSDGDFYEGTMLYFDVDSTKPATKEQRDSLMKAIADAGRTFDFEKKELKINDFSKHLKYNPKAPSIIEQKSAWSEEDNNNLRDAIVIIDRYRMETQYDDIKKVCNHCIDWLKSIKDRIQPQPKQDGRWKWDEDDEKFFRENIILDLGNADDVSEELYGKIIDWVNLIKKRLS